MKKKSFFVLSLIILFSSKLFTQQIDQTLNTCFIEKYIKHYHEMVNIISYNTNFNDKYLLYYVDYINELYSIDTPKENLILDSLNKIFGINLPEEISNYFSNIIIEEDGFKKFVVLFTIFNLISMEKELNENDKENHLLNNSLEILKLFNKNDIKLVNEFYEKILQIMNR